MSRSNEANSMTEENGRERRTVKNQHYNALSFEMKDIRFKSVGL